MEDFILKEVLSVFPQADHSMVNLAIETAQELGLQQLDPYFSNRVVEIYLDLVRGGLSNTQATYLYTPPADDRATGASKPPKQDLSFQTPPPPKVAKNQPLSLTLQVPKGQTPPPPKVANGQPLTPSKIANAQPPSLPKVATAEPPPPDKIATAEPPPPDKIATAEPPPPDKIATAEPPPPDKIANPQPAPPLKPSFGLASPFSENSEITRGLVSLQNPSGAVEMDILLPYMSLNEALEALESEGNIQVCSSCSRGMGTKAVCTGSHNICQQCLKAAVMNVIQLGLATFSCPVPGCTGQILIDCLERKKLPFSVGLLRQQIQRATTLVASGSSAKTEPDVRCLRCGCTTQLYPETMIHKCTNKECLLEFHFSGKSESKDVASKKQLIELNPAQFAGTACLADPDLSPLHWAKFTESEYLEKGFLLVPLSPASLEFNEVAKFYSKTAKLAVKMVHRIQNKTVWASYVKKRIRMLPILGEEELNEKFMFHGTSKEAVDKIYSNGFDFRNGNHNHKLDQGISFSNKAWIAELYMKQQNSTLVLITAVLAGSRVDWRHPVCLHESCVHKKPNPFEVIVFSNDQCCPAYVVEVVDS